LKINWGEKDLTMGKGKDNRQERQKWDFCLQVNTSMLPPGLTCTRTDL
jgi:hypothetical protein